MATTVIAIRTPDLLIIATDSKVTYRGNPGPPTACKVYRAGSLYFAVAGLDRDTETGYSVKSALAGRLQTTADFAAQVAHIQQVMSQSLTTELNRLRAGDPANYALVAQNGKEVLSMVFAQWDGATPRLAGRGFVWRMNPAPGIRIDSLDCPGNCSDGKTMIFLGEKSAAEKFMKGIEGEDFDLPSLATKLVYLEIDDSPSDVGPPVTELRIDKDGAQWISNEIGCPVEVP